MRCTAERRFVWNACLRNPCLLWNLSVHSRLPTRSLRSLRGTVRSSKFCIMLASCPSLRCSCRKKIRLMQRSKGFCSGVVVSKTCLDLLQCSDCALSCAIWLLRNTRTLVEIERLATVGWKWVCQRFSCPCSQHVTHCPKEICLTCLFKESISAKSPVVFLAKTFNSWTDQRVGKSGSLSGCIMHAKNKVSVSKIWITGYWFWSGLSCVATASNPRRIVHIQHLSKS